MRYGLERDLRGTTVDQAIERVTAALAREGFGVLTRIDVKDTLKKLDLDFRGYVIADPQISLLLPCNMVQEAGDGVIVSIADPKVMFQIVDNPALAPIVDEADQRLRRVIATLE